MFQGLKIALRRQKKLIVIFVLTIFLPTAALSFFGIRALRNEKFRLEERYEEEQLKIADEIRWQISTEINEIENTLQNLSGNSLITDKEYEDLRPILESQKLENPLLEQFFMVLNESNPWFPDFNISTGSSEVLPTQYTLSQQSSFKIAEHQEFVRNNYSQAISLYKQLLTEITDKTHQSRILNHLARNLMKSKQFREASKVYSRIKNEYKECKTSTGIPLAITARYQLITCHINSGNEKNAAAEAIGALKETLLNWNELNENQFNTYVAMATNSFNELYDRIPENDSDKKDLLNQYELLNTDFNNKKRQWQMINELKNTCIPEIQQDLAKNTSSGQNTLRYSKSIGDNNYLILTTLIADNNRDKPQGFLGVKINNDFLEKDLLRRSIESAGINGPGKLVVSDLKGRVIYGEKISNGINGLTTFFNDNFPPWRIEMTNKEFEGMFFQGFYKSFYFWTILTILIILFFGVFLVMRTIAHEMDVLKLKSEFVSSVSHEFKTPITSIKALTERLLDGKVNNPDRINEYYSVIIGDADNLSHLVNNLLDFARIEEGKKQYDFENTDISTWINQLMTNINGEYLKKGIRIKSIISNHLPSLAIDRSAMKLAIKNLIDNAIKFSSGKMTVEMIVERSENDLLIKVRDKGTGITREDLNKIFDKFYRGKNATNHAVTGTGLGLTLVKQVVEAHNGEVVVDSEVNKGSTFTIKIPLKENVKVK